MITLIPKHRPKIQKTIDAISKERFLNLPLDKITILPLKCDVKLLPYLAIIFSVDINNLSENEAREMIQNAFVIHFYAGTPYALIRVLKTIYLDSKITEWFSYNGRPYHFRVDIDSKKGINEDTFLNIERCVNKYKNARSILESFRVFLTNKCEVYFNLANVSSEECSILPYQTKSINLNSPSFFNTALYALETINIYPKR